MKKEKTEELIVKWIDGQLDPDEERQLSAFFQEDSDLEKELHEMKALSESVSAELPSSVEPLTVISSTVS